MLHSVGFLADLVGSTSSRQTARLPGMAPDLVWEDLSLVRPSNQVGRLN
jgi:hypothetical protein